MIAECGLDWPGRPHWCSERAIQRYEFAQDRRTPIARFLMCVSYPTARDLPDTGSTIELILIYRIVRVPVARAGRYWLGKHRVCQHCGAG